MNRKLLPITTSLVLCLLTTVCQGQEANWQHAIHGKWQCDADKTIAEMTASGATDAEIEPLREMLPGMAVEFSEDSLVMKMKASGFNDERKASYKVTDASEEKKWLKLEIVMESSETKTGEVTLLDGNSMQLASDDGSVLFFSRIKEENSGK